MVDSTRKNRPGGRCATPLGRSVLALAVLGLAAVADSQGTSTSQKPPPSIRFVTLQDGLNQRLSIHQVRKVLDPQGGIENPWISVPETLELGRSANAKEPRFQLRIDERAATRMSIDQLEKLRRAYDAHSSTIQRYASFHVESPIAAERNYFILYIDERRRIGRPAHRIAVLPRVMGRDAWLLEIDAATGYPLFQARYNAAGILVASIEVTSITRDPDHKVDWWSPRLPTTEFSTLDQAMATANHVSSSHRFTWPLAEDLPSGFALDTVRVVQSDLRPSITIVASYTDGVDSLFVLEATGRRAPSQPRPETGSSETPYAIFTFDDGTFAQYWFHRNDVEHSVVGSSGNVQLPGMIQNLLERALR